MGKAAPLPEKKGTMCDALGSCLHWTRIGMHSYQHPSVAYGSARNQKDSAQNGPCEKSRPDFSLLDGRLEFSNLARSLAAM